MREHLSFLEATTAAVADAIALRFSFFFSQFIQPNAYGVDCTN